jgi:hypothetical protein
MEGFKNLFTRDYVLTREMVKGSMEVYPIKDFGAIQTASHVFSHVENGKPEKGTFKFMHIWKKENGAWKVSRIDNVRPLIAGPEVGLSILTNRFL